MLFAFNTNVYPCFLHCFYAWRTRSISSTNGCGALTFSIVEGCWLTEWMHATSRRFLMYFLPPLPVWGDPFKVVHSFSPRCCLQSLQSETFKKFLLHPVFPHLTRHSPFGSIFLGLCCEISWHESEVSIIEMGNGCSWWQHSHPVRVWLFHYPFQQNVFFFFAV